MRKPEILKEILVGIAALGVIAVVATIAPSLPLALMSIHKPLKKYKQSQIRRSFDYLKQKKMIGVGQDGDKTLIKLTESGKTRLLRFKFDELKIERKNKWDNKWRVVVFDIPEQFKPARQALSRKLREIGFQPLQKSVWICPYPCQDEIDMIVAVYEIDPFIRLLTVDSSQLEKSWQKKFNLI